eukprot:UN17816
MPMSDLLYIFIAVPLDILFIFSSIIACSLFHPIVYSQIMLLTLPIIYLYLCGSQEIKFQHISIFMPAVFGDECNLISSKFKP